MSKNRGLGKGLSALISESNVEVSTNEDTVYSKERTTLPLNLLVPGKFQPRRNFSNEALHELSESIKKNGVVLPIVVRRLEEDNKYQIIAGERRWRASKLAGLEEVPVIVRDLNDNEALEFALIENIQRQDLSPLEEAEGYERLMQEFNYTQEQLATSLGKSRSHVTNLLRLLSLPNEIKKLLDEGQLSMGHARALINVENNIELAYQVVENGMSVRDLEKLAANGKASSKKKVNYSSVNAQAKDQDIINLEESITKTLGMKVKIEETEDGGRVVIFFHNLEQLDTIIQKLNESI
jgi:ParB family chromosome partitioning protein